MQQTSYVICFPSVLTLKRTAMTSPCLRAPDEESRHNEEQKFVADLKKIKKLKI